MEVTTYYRFSSDIDADGDEIGYTIEARKSCFHRAKCSCQKDTQVLIRGLSLDDLLDLISSAAMVIKGIDDE